MEKSVEESGLQAVILCAGRGSRLGELTEELPKPMVPILGKPLLEHIIENYKASGIRKFIIPVAYKKERIIDYFGDGANLGVNITYVNSTIEAETGGSFSRCAEHLRGNDFIMQYGDVMLLGDINTAIKEHINRDAITTALYIMREKIERFQDSNNIVVNDSDIITMYKPNSNYDANALDMGVMIMNRKVFDILPNDNYVLSNELFPKLIGQKALYGFKVKDYIDIGNMEKLKESEEKLRIYLSKARHK